MRRASSDRKRRVAVVTSHPIQYHAPWFRGLAQRADLHVFFAHRQSQQGQADAGYGVAFDWDTDVVGGYAHSFLRNVSRSPGVYAFGGCDTPEVTATLRDGRFDAVIVTGWYLKSYWQAVWAARRLGMPVIVRGDSQLATPRSLARRIAKQAAYRVAFRQFSAFLSVGSRHDAYLKHYGVSRDRIFFAPHFVDPQVFSDPFGGDECARGQARAEMGAAEGTALVLFVGRFVDQKRPLDLVRALGVLAREGLRVHGAFAGAGPLADTLREVAAQEGASLSLLGFRNQSGLPRLYAAADLLVLPSDARETWGVVANEAISCGTPVVASDATGCSADLFDNGRLGQSYPCGDVAGLARALEASLGLRALPETAAALARATAKYSVESAVDGTLAAIETACAAGR